MSERQSDMMELLNVSLNAHMEICELKRKAKRLEAKVKRLAKAGDLICRMASTPVITQHWKAVKKTEGIK